MTVGTKRCICTSICVPPRMRSNAVGGRLLNSSLAWDGAVMMPLHYFIFIHTVISIQTYSRSPSPDMSQPGIEPGPPQREVSTLEKSHLIGLFNCYSEPLKYCCKHSPLVTRSSEHLHMSARLLENAHNMAPSSACVT
jgi:hypothetical protein